MRYRLSFCDSTDSPSLSFARYHRADAHAGKEKMNKSPIFLVTFVIALAISIVGTLAQNQNNNRAGGRNGPSHDVFLKSGGTKICRIFQNPDFGDTMRVPHVWSPRNCKQIAVSMLRTGYFQLGCIFNSNEVPFAWGAPNDLSQRPDRRSMFPTHTIADGLGAADAVRNTFYYASVKTLAAKQACFPMV